MDLDLVLDLDSFKDYSTEDLLNSLPPEHSLVAQIVHMRYERACAALLKAELENGVIIDLTEEEVTSGN